MPWNPEKVFCCCFFLAEWSSNFSCKSCLVSASKPDASLSTRTPRNEPNGTFEGKLLDSVSKVSCSSFINSSRWGHAPLVQGAWPDGSHTWNFPGKHTRTRAALARREDFGCDPVQDPVRMSGLGGEIPRMFASARRRGSCSVPVFRCRCHGNNVTRQKVFAIVWKDR